MPERDLRTALIQDIEQIEDNAALYWAGRESAFQAVSIQLRGVLCRPSGQVPLATRVLGPVRLHRLKASTMSESLTHRVNARDTEAFILDTRQGSLTIGGDGPPRLRLGFSLAEDPLSLAEWLAQWVINPQVSIETLINDTANDEVAHTNESIRTSIGITNAFRFAGSGVSREIHHMTVVALGDYVADRLRALLAEAPGSV